MPATSADLLPELERLLASKITDRELLRGLEVLAQKGPLGELTYRYGPDAYARDRKLLGPFVLQHFMTYRVHHGRFALVAYKDHAKRLDAWLEAVDLARDIELFRHLWTWKHQRDPKRWLAELRQRHASAVTAPARAEVREMYTGLVFHQLDEDAALELYQADRAAAPFILAHAPMRGWTGTTHRWIKLEKAARDARDEPFELELYRRLVGDAELHKDLLALARDRSLGGVALADALDRRTPPWPRNFAPIALALLEARDGDAVPYIVRHAHQLGMTAYGTTKNVTRKLIDAARARGHLDLWARVMQNAASNEDYDELIRSLLEHSADDRAVLADLARLSGVVAEHNVPGLGIARIRALGDDTALAFYLRFPALLRQRWKTSLFAGWHAAYPKLIAHLVEVGDEALLDYLASRLVTRDLRWMPGDAKETIELLAAYYEGLRHDEARFAPRATNVLSQVPAFAVWGFDKMIHHNRLGRLLFLRGHQALLADPRGVGDLLESANIYVQALAFRALGSDDARAPAIGAQHLRILVATLLRPLQRKTRLLAFGALRRAASTPESAALVLSKAREALAMPEKGYPREALIGLIGDVLHRFPALRKPSEMPRVFRAAAATAEVRA